MRLLFTSPGRRVELIELFKKTLLNAEILGADFDNTSPADYIVDKLFKVPFKINDAYVDEVLGICKRERVDVLIPLIDYELPYISNRSAEFRTLGTLPLVSDATLIDICYEKVKIYDLFSKFDVKVPKTALLSDFRNDFDFERVVLKPNKGSASKGIYTISPENLQIFVSALKLKLDEYVVQEFIDFDYEVTVDVFVDAEGELVELCQRQRLKTRGGEVERGKTLKDSKITEIVVGIANKISAFGVINIQLVHNPEDDEFYLIEINPRFGGGYPLAHKAGANFIEHIKSVYEGVKPNKFLDNRYKDDFYMLRFDKAVYVKELRKYD